MIFVRRLNPGVSSRPAEQIDYHYRHFFRALSSIPVARGKGDNTPRNAKFYCPQGFSSVFLVSLLSRSNSVSRSRSSRLSLRSGRPGG